MSVWDDPARARVLHWLTVFRPAKRANLEAYLEMTRDHRETMEMVMVRLGISERTYWRYEMDIRAALEVK